MTKSNQYLLIMGIVSFALPVIFLIQFSGTDYIDGIIHDGFNHLLRPLLFFLVLEPFIFLWKKYIRENELALFEHKIKDLNDLLIFIRRSKKPCKRFVDYFATDKYDMIWV